MDDSLKIYETYCESGISDTTATRIRHIINLVNCIYHEIFTAPFHIKNSSFICKAVELARDFENSDSICCSTKMHKVFLCDSYFVVQELLLCFQNDTYKIKYSPETEYLAYVFQSRIFRGTGKSEAKKMLQRLKSIKEIVDAASQELERKNNYSELKKQTFATENEEDLADSQQKIAERYALRESNNQLIIKNWHSNFNDFTKQLMSIQPSISKLLEKVMTLSDTMITDYILQFGKMNIDLYNLISDAYNYHVITSEKSENGDYINAVYNYKEFQYEIIDNLAAFGIEEIVSVPGKRFDKTIHEVVDNKDFSPRTSVVKESLRSGFKHSDLVIQKERIRVEETNETRD